MQHLEKQVVPLRRSHSHCASRSKFLQQVSQSIHKQARSVAHTQNELATKQMRRLPLQHTVRDLEECREALSEDTQRLMVDREATSHEMQQTRKVRDKSIALFHWVWVEIYCLSRPLFFLSILFSSQLGHTSN